MAADKKRDEEGERIHNEVTDWIKRNNAQFKENDEELYDPKNLERIKRFAYAPTEYLDERIELNKEVLKDYHKLHHSILLAGITGFFAILLSQSIIEYLKTYQVQYAVLIIILVFIPIIIVGMKIHLSTLILKWIGLLKVIRDSEIEIYYLTKIKEYRKSLKS